MPPNAAKASLAVANVCWAVAALYTVPSTYAQCAHETQHTVSWAHVTRRAYLPSGGNRPPAPLTAKKRMRGVGPFTVSASVTAPCERRSKAPS